MRLRNLGVYTLPDGSRFVVDTVDRGGYCLFPLQTWTVIKHPKYRVNADGQLHSEGLPTNWRVEQLTDTGREERYPRPVPPL